ncbi:MAG TPA: hypothetical protein VGD64_14605 [Acidisarcina sp.]
MRIRSNEATKEKEGDGKGQLKPSWQRFLESVGGAAIITVALGTLGGAVITGLIQSANQRQQTRQLSIAEYVKGEHETVKSAFDIVGQCIAAAENLSTITVNEFNTERFPQGEQRNLVLLQKKALRDEFNRMDQQWRATRETLTLNMRYYHGNDAEVGAKWDGTSATLSAYIDCQQGWYMQHLSSFVDSGVADKACSGERSSLDLALKGLSDALAKNRLYEWGDTKTR